MHIDLAEILVTHNLEKELSYSFKGCYSCTRVWEAWSYGTMTVDDFQEFQKGDTAFDEAFSTIIKHIKNGEIKNTNDIIHFLENNYELFYNQDLEYDFSSEAFSYDYTSYLDYNRIECKLTEALDDYIDLIEPIQISSKNTMKNKLTI